MVAGLAEFKAGLAKAEARQLNQAVSFPMDPIAPMPGGAPPFALPAAGPAPLYFPATLQELAHATRGQLAALLEFYNVAPMPPEAPGSHAHAAATEQAALREGANRLGTHLGVAMAGSRDRVTQLLAVRALNASAHVQEHILEPPRSKFPPFFLPEEAAVAFPATAADFHRMGLADAQALGGLYGLPARHGANELSARLRDIAHHIGYRFYT
jgi:hypothetical protein